MTPLITVTELSKHFKTFSRREGVLGSLKDLFQRTYKDVLAVNRINFSINEGELVGYIGPNGAGKSTSIKMLTGILKPTGGEISVMGFHPFSQRKQYTSKIGVVFGQRTQLWWDIAVIESLKLLAKIYGVHPNDFNRRLTELREILGLDEILHTPVRKLSLGQRIRSDLAASLIHAPKVLYLDEPTIGLDAVGKDNVRRFLRKINQEFKTTILLTTHDLREIEELCNRVIIIDKGIIIYDGSLDRIRELPGLNKQMLIDYADKVPENPASELTARVGIEVQSERRILINYDPKAIATLDLIKAVTANGPVADFTVSDPGIEDIVMKIYKEGQVF